MRRITLAIAGLALLAPVPGAVPPAAAKEKPRAAAPVPAIDPSLAAILADGRRDADRERDVFRHPAETIAFMRIAPDMKVGEYAPGGGWYTRVLAPYLADRGKLVGLYFDPASGPFKPEMQQSIRDGVAGFAEKAAGWSGKPVSAFSGMTTGDITDADKGTFDRIFVARMLHNLLRWNIADSEIKAMRALLKDDGMIGIVQHRAKPDAPYGYTDGTKGYLREADVVRFMEVNGFELVASSEINANASDPANHEQGVWEMPPVLRTKREDLKALGESDRMTLLFRKRR